MRLKIAFILILSILSTSIGLKAQDSPHTIKVQVKGLKDTVAYLANYYGDKLFYNDTSRVDSEGRFEFKGKTFDECGKYAIVTPGPKFFEFIVAEENISFETDTADLVGNLIVHESKENDEFFKYLKLIQAKRKEREPIDFAIRDSLIKEKEKVKLREQLKTINQEVVDYQNDLFENKPDMLFTKMVQMSIDVEIPDAPEGVEDEKAWKYYHYRDHFWDNVDLTDSRLVRDQMFAKLFNKYWGELLPQIPDTLAVQGPKLAAKMKNNDMFKYTVHQITYGSEKSNIMCMDKVFVTMVERYYKTGQADWLTDEQLSKVIEASDKKRNTMCGERVPNIILPDTSLTNWVNLYEIDSKYTVMIIWESTCGHCKKEMPKLKEFYDSWKDKGVEIVALGNDFETEPWLKFLRDKDYGWIDFSDNPQINAQDSATALILNGVTTLPSLNFRKTFDVFSTPKIFLLDEDKRVLAKQLSTEQIEEMLMNLEGIETEDQGMIEEEESEGKSSKDKGESKKKRKSGGKG